MKGRKKFFDDDIWAAVNLLYWRDWSANKIARLLHIDPSVIQREFKQRGVKMRRGHSTQLAYKRDEQKRMERGS